MGPRRRRSRSPLDGADRQVPNAEKAVKAPVYVEPGSENDTEGMRSNARRVFEYLPHVEQVLNDHADVLNSSEDAQDICVAKLSSSPSRWPT